MRPSVCRTTGLRLRLTSASNAYLSRLKIVRPALLHVIVVLGNAVVEFVHDLVPARSSEGRLLAPGVRFRNVLAEIGALRPAAIREIHSTSVNVFRDCCQLEIKWSSIYVSLKKGSPP